MELTPVSRCVWRPRSRSGMTLIEIMIAAFVLVIVFGAVMATVVRAATLTRDSKVVYRSTAIANDIVERMRSMTFEKLKTELQTGNPALGITVGTDLSGNSCTRGEVPPETPSGAGTGPVLAGEYKYVWTRTCGNIAADPLRIQVVVWPEGLEARKIKVVTYISASGLIDKSS